MTLSTHVLDTAAGRPAAGVRVRLERRDGSGWRVVSTATTGVDGRIGELATGLVTGSYRLVFDTGEYYAACGVPTLYPEVAVTVQVAAGEHYHLPLLLSPFGYSTYRGS